MKHYYALFSGGFDSTLAILKIISSNNPVKVSPIKAITRRSEGIVLMDPELCIGEMCKKCIEACALGVIQINPQKNVAEKCNLCVDRVDAGLLPACITGCPSQCMYYGEMNGFMQNIIKRLYYFTLLPDFTELPQVNRT